MKDTIERVQQGKEEISVLWDKVKGYIHKAAYNRYREAAGRGSCDRHGCEIADYENSGFIALTKAVASYNPDKGEFLPLLSLFLKSEFDTAAGRRSTKQKADPLHTAMRMEELVDGTELSELIAGDDDTEETAIENVFRDGLKGHLRELISDLSPDQQAEVTAAFFAGKSPADRAKETGIPVKTIKQRLYSGLRELRILMERTAKGRRLRNYVDDSTNWAYYVGVEQYQSSHTSSVEKLVLERERRLRKLDERKL